MTCSNPRISCSTNAVSEEWAKDDWTERVERYAESILSTWVENMKALKQGERVMSHDI